MHDKSNEWEIVKLRAHHLLCYHGFSGHGYDERFVDNMKAIMDKFLANPETVVQIVSGPDVICDSCPHLGKNGCEKGGDPDEEKKTHELDLSVMKVSGIRDSSIMTARKAFESVEKTIDAQMLESICKTCEWLEIGHCRERISRRFFENIK